MRTIETTLWPIETPRDDLGEGVLLNDGHTPELAGLTEGKRVQLLEPNELVAEDIVHRVAVPAGIWWFAEIDNTVGVTVMYEPYTEQPFAPIPKDYSELVVISR